MGRMCLETLRSTFVLKPGQQLGADNRKARKETGLNREVKNGPWLPVDCLGGRQCF